MELSIAGFVVRQWDIHCSYTLDMHFVTIHEASMIPMQMVSQSRPALIITENMCGRMLLAIKRVHPTCTLSLPTVHVQFITSQDI